MNILKAIQSLKPNQSITVEHGVRSRHDVGGKAIFKMTYPNGSTKEDWILSRMLNHPAYVLELIWGLDYLYLPSKGELLAWLERYRFEQPSMLAGIDLQKIAKFILERKPEPAYRALVCNRLFEYIFNHKGVQK